MHEKVYVTYNEVYHCSAGPIALTANRQCFLVVQEFYDLGIETRSHCVALLINEFVHVGT
jgi:hypothetical protein